VLNSAEASLSCFESLLDIIPGDFIRSGVFEIETPFPVTDRAASHLSILFRANRRDFARRRFWSGRVTGGMSAFGSLGASSASCMLRSPFSSKSCRGLTWCARLEVSGLAL
jgi:hypothetical protein